MYVSIRFVLWLKWIDSRLTYKNLAEDYYRNRLSKVEAANSYVVVAATGHVTTKVKCYSF